MTATILFLTLLAVGLYILIATLLPKETHTSSNTTEDDFKNYWKSIRSKQGRFSAASRQR